MGHHAYIVCHQHIQILKTIILGFVYSLDSTDLLQYNRISLIKSIPKVSHAASQMPSKCRSNRDRFIQGSDHYCLVDAVFSKLRTK